MWGTVPSLGPS
ncbi:hypothetical protein LINPERHAP1_LOCUS25239 [Linum perenne]